MQKDKTGLFDIALVKHFFTVRLNIWIIVSSIIASLVIYFYYASIPRTVIFPGRHDLTFEFYTDSANGGHSTILSHIVSDSSIDLDFALKEGFISPYVGMGITNNDRSVFNLGPYNRLRLELAGEQIRTIGVGIFARNTYSDSSGEVCFTENLDIGPERKQYVFDLALLKVPDWWYVAHNTPTDEKIGPDLKHIYSITIGSALTSAADAKRSLRIYSMSFERDNKRLAVILGSANIILFFLLFAAYYTKAYRALPVTITYKAVDTDNENRQMHGFLDYINTHFHDPDLTLMQVSDQTGINQRRITASIQQEFDCNFKTYVNRLRINESKRLLVESELNMGEIAFKVGFSNQSHFNRVFKNFEKISPSQFIQNKQQ